MTPRNRFAVVALVLSAWWTLGVGRAQEKDRTAEIKKLQEERAELLDKAFAGLMAQYEMGLAPPTEIGAMARDVCHARLPLLATPQERIALRQTVCQALKKTVEMVEQRKKVGAAKQLDVDLARGVYLTEEIELGREKLKLKASAETEAQLQKLLKQRAEALDQALAQVLAQYEVGLVDITEVQRCLQGALDARLALHSSVEERIAVLRKRRGSFAQMVEMVESRKRVGVARQIDADQARALLLAEEIELLREEIKQKADAGKEADVKKLLGERSQALDSAAGSMIALYEFDLIDFSQALQIERDATHFGPGSKMQARPRSGWASSRSISRGRWRRPSRPGTRWGLLPATRWRRPRRRPWASASNCCAKRRSCRPPRTGEAWSDRINLLSSR